ncbi:MAG: tRNA-dihydrouridine synthase, partial [Bdellovibrionaceae bacterium]|nr:tRNA-dihydrouridine synthase [Pseudobdellovibrionaceae bacterium]
LREPERLAAILRAVKSAIKIPLTIKIRTGWDANSRNAHEVCRIAWGEGVTWVTIHGRTRAQNYSGLADWDYIAEVKARASIPIIGNGDILTAKQAVSLLASTGCDAVMIGRGALKNPYIFEEAYRLWAGDPQLNSEKNLKQVFLELNKELEQHCDERILSIQLKKFGSWFSSGYPGAASYRKKLFQTQSIKEIIEISVEFFSNVTIDQQQDTSGEAFLMGGHG